MPYIAAERKGQELVWALSQTALQHLVDRHRSCTSAAGQDSAKHDNKAALVLQDDPLTQTLDMLLPAEMRESVVQVPVNIPQGVKDICAELQNEEGIDSVFLGRQVEERRVVSQASIGLLHGTAAISYTR